jgi:hypothetical protein
MVTQEYAKYLKVVNEFFDWAFVNSDLRQQKMEAEVRNRNQIDQELDNIQRTILLNTGEKA